MGMRTQGTIWLEPDHEIGSVTGSDNEWLDDWCEENGLAYRTIAETPYRLTKVQGVAESGEARGAVYEVTIPTTGKTIGVIFSEYSRGWTREASWRYGSRRHGDTVSRSWGYGADIEDARSPDNHTNYSEDWAYALERLIQEYATAQGVPPTTGRYYTVEALEDKRALRLRRWSEDGKPGRPRVEAEAVAA